MERDDDKIAEKQKQQQQKITAYIGLQNEPLGEEPNISISFQISMQLFCVAFAISRMEKDRDD